MRAQLSIATAVLLAACQRAEQPGKAVGQVLCRDLDAHYEATYSGYAALADCVRDPKMQSEGHRRVAQVGPGDFDFGDGRRFELTTGFAVLGAGPDSTRVHVSRPTLSVLQDDIYSTFFVRGANVRLADFTFDGFCHNGPSPGPGCGAKDEFTLLAIVVACGYGMERAPDCDVDGLVVENLRVLGVKTPFLATSSPAHPERNEKGIFANFRDLHWTIRRFQVSDRDSEFRYARIFELGNGATADISRGPGVGVEEPRRYLVDIEDTDIDTHVGMRGGQLAGILTMAVNDDRVDLRVRLTNSHWRGAERLVGIANHSVDGDGGDDGRVVFDCIDSALHADPREFAGRDFGEAGTTACPPFAAAVYVGEFSRSGGNFASRANLVRCPVKIEAGFALCPKPGSLDLGDDAIAAHVSACLEESSVDPPPRGAGRIVPPPCLEKTEPIR
jgi:hypothetical protein